MKPEILVVGLDAATMDLVEPWAEAGHLPALARLMREGASARLLSTPNMHSASAWTSILTGLNPGRHGLYVFSDRDFSTGRQSFFKGGDRTGEIIGSLLFRHGLTAGLLNVPMTYPAECSPGGFMVSGLDAPSLNEKAFCPADLRDELFKEFPGYNFAPAGIGDLMGAGRVDAAIREWMKMIETQTEAARYLIASRPTSFFMTVYTASDWGGHNLWKYFDTTRPDYSEAGRALYGNALLDIYRALDRSIESLLEQVGEQATTYVISDHGMGPHTGASYQLADWLESHGYMVRNNTASPRASLIDASRRAARDLLPLSLREKIKSGLGAERMNRLRTAEKDSFYSSIDWERTTCYTEPGRHVININLAGRNSRGKVQASEYEAVCRRIIEDLGRWVDGRGQRVVERVARRDEVYFGPFRDRASDLYVYWNPAAQVGEPPREVRARGFWWSGDHRPEGILIAKGPGIRAGVRVEPPKVYDLVPTILHLAGLPVPAGLDGRVIESICSDEFLSKNRIRVEPASTDAARDEGSLSASDEDLIEEKLRGLGYM